MKRVISLIVALSLLLCLIPSAISFAGESFPYNAVVTGGWLRLRSTASYGDNNTVASYYTGTVVTVQSIQNGWYFVTTPDSYTGWMRGEYLQKTNSTTSGAVGTTMTVISKNGGKVNLRSSPSTAYSSLGLYPVGTKAYVLSVSDTWYQVSIGNKQGYMMKQFLSSGTSSTSQSSYTAYVTSGNGLGVRLRSGAGTNFSVIGLYNVGTQVTVLQRYNSTWDYVKIDYSGTKGYMMHQFLTSDNAPSYSANVNAITGSATLPSIASPGDKVAATVNVNTSNLIYTWKIGNSVVGNSRTIVIKNSWAGKSLYLQLSSTDKTGCIISANSCQILDISVDDTPAASIPEQNDDVPTFDVIDITDGDIPVFDWDGISVTE